MIDFSRFLPGSFAGQRLGDLGAEVIKIESPETGDPIRSKDGGLPFYALSRSKKSVTLNLKVPEGQRLAWQLGCTADVIIESFRPGVAAAMGIGYEGLRKENPAVIYCSLTGLGQSGQLSSLGSHDLNYQALSGILAQLTDAAGRPIVPKIQFGDLIGGMAASEAILAALVKRSFSSQGSYLDCAITDSLTGLMSVHSIIQSALGTGDGIEELSGQIISYNIYETGDGRYVSLSAVESKFWENFCLAVEKKHWIGKQLTKADHQNEIHLEIISLFKSRSFREWEEFSARVDCCMAAVLETNELVVSNYVVERGLLTDNQAGSRGILRHLTTSAGGLNKQLNDRVNNTPSLGEHTAEVLKDLLSVSPDQIEDWRKRGVI